jgi:23S rRNA pseudouridine2605 synthase
MSDKSKKGGGGRGRPPQGSGARRGSGGPPRGKPPFRPRGEGRGAEGERGSRNGTDRPFRREDGDRPARRRDEGGGDAPVRERAGKPFRPRGGAAPDRAGRPERPFRRREDAGAEGPPRERSGKPFRSREERPFRERRERSDGERTFHPRGEASSDRAGPGARPYRRREEAGGEAPPRERSGKPFRSREDRPFRERRERGEGDRPFRPRGEGERPFRPRGEASGAERPRGPFRPRQEDRGRSGPRGDSVRTPRRPTEERVAKVIARAGLCSRRDAEAWIAEGRVAVNGEVLASPARDVTPKDVVTVDGTPIPRRERTRVFLYNKPRGLVTTARDPEGRPTVFESLPPGLPRLVSVGRLDINTEGLLVLTNDGGVARVLELPDTGWLRRYRVRAFGDITQDRLDTLRDGVTIDDIHYGPVEARLDRSQGDNVWLTLGLREGKNREVKRILEHLGMTVNRLIRVSFGPFQLGDLGEGAVEEVRTRVLQDQLGPELAAQAQADFEAPVFVYDEEPEEDERPAFGRSAGGRRGGAPEEDRRGAGRDRERDAERPRRRSRLEPTRSVWRADDDADAPKGRQPRRGADPRFARIESAEREHRRSGTVETRSGRRVLVERLAPDAAADSPARPARPPRDGGRPEFRGKAPGGEARPKRRFATESPGGREERGERPRFDKPRGPRGDRPAGAGSDRPARGGGGRGAPRPGGKGPGKGPRPGGRPGGGRPRKG